MGALQPSIESHPTPDAACNATEPKQEEQLELGQRGHDANLVDWDGPDDPQNPLNWSRNKKIGSAAVVSLITVLTYGYYPKRTPC